MNPLSAILAILRRELASAFDTPLAYFLIPTYGLMVGGFALWFEDVLATGIATMRPVFFWGGVGLVLLVPALTMRVFAEERRSGNLELLLTLPLEAAQLVLGKFLAAYALVLLSIAATAGYAPMLQLLGQPGSNGMDWGPVLGGYLGLALLGAALTAVGTATSALAAHPVVSFLLALLGGVALHVPGYFLDRLPAGWAVWLQPLTLSPPFEDLARGVVSTSGLVSFGLVIAGALHVAAHALERRQLQ